MHKPLLFALATAPVMLLTMSMTGIAQAAPDRTNHAITCNWVTEGTPYRFGGAVQGVVHVHCSDNLDDANTQAQLQIKEGGVFRDYGVEVKSYSTSTEIYVTDGAAYRSAGFRVQGTHFGRHGNIFSLPTYYSGTRII